MLTWNITNFFRYWIRILFLPWLQKRKFINIKIKQIKLVQHQRKYFYVKNMENFAGKINSNQKSFLLNWKYFSFWICLLSIQGCRLCRYNFKMYIEAKNEKKKFSSTEFKICLSPPARELSTLNHHTCVRFEKIVLFKLNWQKDFIELFVKRKYLLSGFISEKWFFICRIFHPSKLLLILDPQSKIERQRDEEGEGIFYQSVGFIYCLIIQFQFGIC